MVRPCFVPAAAIVPPSLHGYACSNSHKAWSKTMFNYNYIMAPWIQHHIIGNNFKRLALINIRVDDLGNVVDIYKINSSNFTWLYAE